MKKTGRNEPCPCGSGKKFKKCCESKMIGGRFMATKVDAVSAPQVASAFRLTGLFQARVSEITQPTSDFKPIRATTKNLLSPASQIESLIDEQAPIKPLQEEEVERKDDI